MLTRRSLLNAAAVTLAGSSVTRHLTAQTNVAEFATTSLGPLVLLRGSGCNVVAISGNDGALCIDGGTRENAVRLHAAVLRATDADRIDTLINTHWHPEQTGLNELVGAGGGKILAHEKTKLFVANTAYSALYEAPIEPLPAAAQPDTIVREDGSLQFGGQQIDYGYLPAAHTDGDLYLHFADLDVLVAGGVVAAESWPPIDYRAGAWYGGRVRALQWLAELAGSNTTVIPAHGSALSGADLIRQRDIYEALFESMIDYMNRGFGPEDVVERNPLARYTAEFGDASAFLDGAYRSMLIAYVPD